MSALSASVVVFRYLGLVVDPRHVRSGYDVTIYGSLLAPPVLASVLELVRDEAQEVLSQGRYLFFLQMDRVLPREVELLGDVAELAAAHRLTP